ncbi:membrane protein insertion efficiency factor YidD [Campylobacter sp. Cr9]|uniref:membrane protein insertion efficiency factor YidD n=1 Tax=Campylobacter sp. Cr9 TaxID=2735728 RepID=UPI0030149598|nr:membrane protein insertion efficiency factor YidD [Campylobacter sp. Cr9]
MHRYLAVKLVEFYRYFLSPLKPKSCRYYPTCSQYAIIQLQYNNFFKAILLTFLRLLRCNQLFVGGFDYPTIKLKNKPIMIFTNQNKIQKLKTIFVPKDKQFYYIVKVIFK